MKKMTGEMIVNAKTAELVAWFNEHAEKPVVKFATRSIAERRCLDLLKEVEAKEHAEKHTVKTPSAKKDAAPKKEKAAPLSDDERHAKMSAAQRESWKDPEVSDARRERSAVIVDGVQYKSLAAAWDELGISGGFGKFRLRLKEAGVLKGERGHDWEVVPLNY